MRLLLIAIIYKKFIGELLLSLWKLAVATIITQWLQVAASFFSTRFLAQTNQLDLAALAISYRYYLLVLIFASGVQMAIAVTLARSPAEQRSKKLGQATAFSVLLAIPTAAVFYCCPFVLHKIHITADLLQILTPYFHILALASLFMWLAGTWRQALLAFAKPAWLLALSAAYFLVHLTVSYILIKGAFGCPQFGLAGAAWAELSGLAVVASLAGWRLLKDYSLFKLSHYNWDEFYRQWQNSWPVSGLWLNEMLAMFVLVTLLAKIGQVTLAAYQLVSQLDMLLLMIPYGVSMALAVVVANTRVNECFSLQKQRLYLRQGLIMVLFPLTLASVFFISNPEAVLKLLFQPTAIMATALTLAAKMLIITAVYQLFDAVRKVMIGLLRGHGDTRWPFAISAFCFWGIAIVGALTLKHLYAGQSIRQAVAIWLCLAAAMLCGAILMCARYIYLKRSLISEEFLQAH